MTHRIAPNRLGSLVVGAFLLWGIALAQGKPVPITFTATLSSDRVVEPVESAGSGEVRALLIGNELVVTGTYQGLSSPVDVSPVASGANIRMAAPGETGSGVRLDAEQTTLGNSGRTTVLRTDGGTAGGFSGVFTLTDEQVEALKQGLYYVQLYTKENPTGELRGQLGAEIVLDATAEDMVGIWRNVHDGSTYQHYSDRTWNYLTPSIEIGEAGRPENKWEFEDNVLTVFWHAGQQAMYTELYPDGRRRDLVLEASGLGSDRAEAWYELVKIDEEGNRVNLRD